MVTNQHEIACVECAVNSTGSVGQKQDLRPHKSHEPCGKHHIAHRIPLIEVNTALHDHNRNAVYIAEDKPALVSRHRRHRKPFDIFVINGRGNLDLLRVFSQTGA